MIEKDIESPPVYSKKNINDFIKKKKKKNINEKCGYPFEHVHVLHLGLSLDALMQIL